jgi:hypothetical protein
MPTGEGGGQGKGAWCADGRSAGTVERFGLGSGARDGVQSVCDRFDGLQTNGDRILGLGEVCRHQAVDDHRVKSY